MPKKGWNILLLLLLPLFQLSASPESDTSLPVRTVGVAQGLPQSFISGMVQDQQGFIWIATRDGLARYDGRKCKVFNHVPGDTTTLSGSIISNLYYDCSGWLWILYESREIDLLNTATEKLQHLGNLPAYQAANGLLKGNITAAKSFADDGEGNIWMPGRQGVFIFNIKKNNLRFYTNKQIGITGDIVFGLAKYGKEMLLVTDTAFVTVDAQCRITKVLPYHFPRPWLHSHLGAKDVYPVVRKNGEIVLLDEERLIICQPTSGAFTIIPLPPDNIFVFTSILQDETGNIFFDYNGNIYLLPPNNKLQLLRKKAGIFPQSQCMLLDRSGMLWIGGNGTGIRLYDQRLTHLWGRPYGKEGFIKEALMRDIKVLPNDIKSSFIDSLNNYWLRWAKAKDGTIWMAEANEHLFTGNTCRLANSHLQQQTWKIAGADSNRAALQSMNALAFSSSGELWGIDYRMRPVHFDPASGTATVYPGPATTVQGVNSLVMDGETIFWISSISQGLYRYNLTTGKLRKYTPDEQGRGRSASRISMLLQDPADTNKLWIGTLGSGLLHFNKRTGQPRVYTTADGLPNNTVYAMLPDVKGRLWCSTNRGIFRFDPKTGGIYSFTSKDGLAGDEFNRFHFLSLPDGRMAFGGVDGYVVFDPIAVSEDDFDPEAVLTDISINNEPADYGRPASPLDSAINSVPAIELPYTSNILGFEFAALEYNVPEKLQYRYMLQGFDKYWINAGPDNKAIYTNLLPGGYTLFINATNTAGKWGNKIKKLRITISPPFWKTTWFILLCSGAAAGLAWWAIQSRIASVKNKARQQLAYERKAMELEAQALRAQMNPHFIFNCLNSIKSLIQEDKKRDAVTYLTTFSKLIRSQLTNAQREVSLYDELETCRLYAQLESLRFSDKITIAFTIAEGLDVHSVMVPPLIIQPFIENAIWHGILPLEAGGQVTVSVNGEKGSIICTIDDNGIGRQTSKRNKPPIAAATHQSKGMQLTQERLDLHNSIHNRGGRLEVLDKTDGQGAATGTRVVIYFKTEA